VTVRKENVLPARFAPALSSRLSLPAEGPRRTAAWSLLMVVAAPVAMILAGLVGTFLEFVVFDLDEQDMLSEAGVPGYVAGSLLTALMVLPGIVGIVLGLRARRLGERRLGTTGIVANALIATYLIAAGVVGLVLG
jgi:hypothetical protein